MVLFKTKEMANEMAKKFTKGQFIFKTFSLIPFLAANIYIFNGYQIQYIYMFSALIYFISSIIIAYHLPGRAS
jgi:hypothetical protein